MPSRTYTTQLGTETATWVCALTGSQTCKILVHRTMLQPTEPYQPWQGLRVLMWFFVCLFVFYEGCLGSEHQEMFCQTPMLKKHFLPSFGTSGLGGTGILGSPSNFPHSHCRVASSHHLLTPLLGRKPSKNMLLKHPLKLPLILVQHL